MHFVCWITKATYAHSEYVILITFPLQAWLSERATILRYTYFASHVLIDGSLAIQVFIAWNGIIIMEE